MNLLYVISICVWASVAMTTNGHPLTDEDLASSDFIQQLLARVDMVEKRGAEQEKEIQILKSAMIQQQQDMEELRSELQTKDRTIETLLRITTHTDGDAKPTSDEIPVDSNKTHGSGETKNVRQVRDAVNRIRQLENEATVAFSAALSQHMNHVGDKQNIVFDKLITNIGNAYNPHHGVFIAPVSGIYVFHAHVLAYDGQSAWAYIAVNGVDQAGIYMHDTSHGGAGQSLVLQLNQGDDVAVHGRAGSSYFGQPTSYTVFSGFLLKQNFTGNVIG